MRVKNVNGSGRFSAPVGYRSWLDYWEKKTDSKAIFCSASNCFGGNLVGAHVQKANSTDNSWYIIPLCSSCNQRIDTFEVSGTLVPVPSNF